jgi:glycosyltransferase involved in cell wall biosynthesis
MAEVPAVLLLVAERQHPAALRDAVARLRAAGRVSPLAASLWPVPDAVAEMDGESARVLSRHAQKHGPRFRREVRRAGPPELFWLHVRDDAWVQEQMPRVAVVLPLDPVANLAAQRLVAQQGHAVVADDVETALTPLTDARLEPLSGWAAGTDPAGDSAWARALKALQAGEEALAERLVVAGLEGAGDLRARADLIGNLVSWQLGHGRQPSLTKEAVTAELAVADKHLAAGRYRAAAESFEEATRTAFHRVLHFDGPTSPLADDPSGFIEPFQNSAVPAALRAPRGRAVSSHVGAEHAGRPTRLLIATRTNADFLGEIREHFGVHPSFEARFVDFAGVGPVDRFAKAPDRLAFQLLSGGKALPEAAEGTFRSHLDWADVVFVEWCTALAALLSTIDPGATRIVVRMHSYEAFTLWPHLTDFSRIDDMIFVSEHLRDFAVAAIPGLQGPDAPRLHVIPNAMELQRFAGPKPDDARFTLGVIGASKPVKDSRWAIEVLRELRRHDDRYRLLLLRGKIIDESAATHEYAEALRRDLDELEPSGAVTVLSHTDDVPTALRDIGVVISSSVRESFHMGLVEGAASGAVPVVRDWPFFPGAARQLFPDDWVVATPSAAAHRILAATASDEVWRATGEAAADYALARWDWPVVRQQFEKLLSGRLTGS